MRICLERKGGRKGKWETRFLSFSSSFSSFFLFRFPLVASAFLWHLLEFAA